MTHRAPLHRMRLEILNLHEHRLRASDDQEARMKKMLQYAYEQTLEAVLKEMQK